MYVCGAWESDRQKELIEIIQLKYLYYRYIIYKGYVYFKSHHTHREAQRYGLPEDIYG